MLNPENAMAACRGTGRLIWHSGTTESGSRAANLQHSSNARQIYNSENSPGSAIADKVDARAIPVIVEVSPLQGI